jgi:hypothetical protein
MVQVAHLVPEVPWKSESPSVGGLLQVGLTEPRVRGTEDALLLAELVSRALLR